ncbi:hypothetical protein P154DRAFT_574342 [Amniculicola lignicola CBS 123094]|uniref:Uncharacterized protein n=1 Tax=Amniculicola lignicola CBS 123094 TaxID=1392246 RepID=A0A6A5WWM0_9PLEO|nr:hypothetical protein P154DRAFT_574342 [Amniculicola lignicola CBS 123094]
MRQDASVRFGHGGAGHELQANHDGDEPPRGFGVHGTKNLLSARRLLDGICAEQRTLFCDNCSQRHSSLYEVPNLIDVAPHGRFAASFPRIFSRTAKRPTFLQFFENAAGTVSGTQTSTSRLMGPVNCRALLDAAGLLQGSGAPWVRGPTDGPQPLNPTSRILYWRLPSTRTSAPRDLLQHHWISVGSAWDTRRVVRPLMEIRVTSYELQVRGEGDCLNSTPKAVASSFE